MQKILHSKIALISIAITVTVLFFACISKDDKIDYSTQVKPIINRKCISCHGGVKAKGGFSLLFREEALAKTESGQPAIIPGDPDGSEMIRRLTLDDPEERMPFKHEPLSKDEIAILRKWVKQGAQWGEHWAYVPVKKTDVPDVDNKWVKNDIDKFIYQKLEEQKLQASPEADKATLLRRVSLDLIGMQPSESVAKKFLQDNGPRAYETLVDSLLASPHFGERWTAMWLDLSRYADTKGYERDDVRSIWRYRDWLIKAFNSDKPYDQFLTEQVAGDLLPNPTDAQYIATAFHRNTMTNDEGGTDNEEFRTAAIIDRVNTTWEAVMGTTFSCVQCHSHPYDPFKHDEYYKFMAYFNNSRDEDTEADYPLLRTFNDTLTNELASLKAWLTKESSEKRAKDIERFIKTWEPSINSLTSDKYVSSSLADTKWLAMRNHSSARFKQVDLQNINQLILRYTSGLTGGVLSMHLDTVNGPVFVKINIQPTKGWQISPVDFPMQNGVHDIYLTYENPTIVKPDQNGMMFDWLHFTQQFPGKGSKDYEANNKLFWKLLTANAPTTPVMMDNPDDMYRPTYVFERGNWLVKGKEVKPSIPHIFAAAMPAKAPANRLGLAMFLTDRQNPLVSRTLVNRMWEQLFGVGIVETLEDMGTQGVAPTHRELLDYLSYNFMNEDNWSVKKLLKKMVMSATYRQDSKLTPELREKDLYNKWYARGARVRLSAEQVRDQALNIGGVMNEELYGPSVFPFQPKGIWQSPYNGAEWVQSINNEQYRRGVYTFWKRTAPYPSMITFDGGAREVCMARRIRTNTPLQALVTLNDEAYVDVARHFAKRMQSAGNTVEQQISKGYELMLYKPIEQQKLQVLVTLYNEAKQKFTKDISKAKEITQEENSTPDFAALVVVANAMLNLDEIVTKN